MNLHETLTNRRPIPHGMSVAFSGQGAALRPAAARKDLMTGTRRYSLLIVLAVLGALLLLPSGASAATCDVGGLIDAAANDRQISQHSVACYQKALAAIPSDSNAYSPELRANLNQAMRRDGTRELTPNTPASRQLQAAIGSDQAAAVVRGPVTNLLEGLGPAHVDQVPLPVIALGGVAGLLLLAGLGTSLARTRARRLAR